MNQLKKLLNERKMQEWKEIENVPERMNSMNGLLGRLNSDVRRNRACVITPKWEELNLP